MKSQPEHDSQCCAGLDEELAAAPKQKASKGAGAAQKGAEAGKAGAAGKALPKMPAAARKTPAADAAAAKADSGAAVKKAAAATAAVEEDDEEDFEVRPPPYQISLCHAALLHRLPGASSLQELHFVCCRQCERWRMNDGMFLTAGNSAMLKITGVTALLCLR